MSHRSMRSAISSRLRSRVSRWPFPWMPCAPRWTRSIRDACVADPAVLVAAALGGLGGEGVASFVLSGSGG